MTASRSSSRRLRRAVLAVAILELGGLVGLGGTGSAAAQPVAAPAKATLSIRALQAAVQPGGTGGIAGNLQVEGLSPQGRMVDLESRPQGEDVFTPIGSAIADENGTVRLSIQPAVTTRYRWRYPGDVDAQARVSGVVAVRVRSAQHATRRRATTLSAVVENGVVSAGARDVVRGQLRWGTKRLAKRQVVLLARSAGQQTWRFRISRRTGGMGRVAFTVRPWVSTEYRLAFAGTSVFRPSTSAVVAVDLRPTLTIGVDPSRIDPGESALLSGSITQAGSPVAGATVELLSRQVAAVDLPAWKVQDRSVSAAGGTVDFAIRPESGSFDYRLRVRPVGGLPRALSAIVTVQVRESSSITIAGQDVSGGFAVSGRLTSLGRSAGSELVTLQALDRQTSVWTDVESALADSAGRVGFVRPSAPGTSYRLSYAADTFAASTSATVTD